MGYKHLTSAQVEQIREMRTSGKTCSEIAALMTISYTCVHKRLLALGLTVSDPKPVECCIAGCGKATRGRKYCPAHYRRLLEGRPVDAPLQRRVWDNLREHGRTPALCVECNKTKTLCLDSEGDPLCVKCEKELSTPARRVA